MSLCHVNVTDHCRAIVSFIRAIDFKRFDVLYNVNDAVCHVRSVKREMTIMARSFHVACCMVLATRCLIMSCQNDDGVLLTLV